MKGGFASSPIKREKDVQYKSAVPNEIKLGGLQKDADPIDSNTLNSFGQSQGISMFDDQIGGGVLQNHGQYYATNNIPFSLDKDSIEPLVLNSTRNAPLCET